MQIGLWLMILQSVLMPHRSGQGSIHFCLTQALFNGHSVLTIHSGLQAGGVPI